MSRSFASRILGVWRQSIVFLLHLVHRNSFKYSLLFLTESRQFRIRSESNFAKSLSEEENHAKRTMGTWKRIVSTMLKGGW